MIANTLQSLSVLLLIIITTTTTTTIIIIIDFSANNINIIHDTRK